MARKHLRSVNLPRHQGTTWRSPCFWLLWNLPLRGIADGHFDDILFDGHAIHLQYGLRRLRFTFILHISQALKEAEPEPSGEVLRSQTRLPPSVLEAGTGQAPRHRVPSPHRHRPLSTDLFAGPTLPLFLPPTVTSDHLCEVGTPHACSSKKKEKKKRKEKKDKNNEGKKRTDGPV